MNFISGPPKAVAVSPLQAASRARVRPKAAGCDLIELILPYPPSVNSIWRRSGAHIHRSTKYTRWLRDAGWAAKAQHPGSVNGPYKLSLNAVRPDKRKRDLSNLLKATEDLLVSLGVIDDDSKAEFISMRWVTTGEGITVRIEQAGTE